MSMLHSEVLRQVWIKYSRSKPCLWSDCRLVIAAILSGSAQRSLCSLSIFSDAVFDILVLAEFQRMDRGGGIWYPALERVGGVEEKMRYDIQWIRCFCY